MSHDLALFGVGTSRTMRAHWMLLELGLEYESLPIQPRSGETLTDEFKRLNPRLKLSYSTLAPHSADSNTTLLICAPYVDVNGRRPARALSGG